MSERTITVTQAVESALAKVAGRVEHEAGCATESDFSATCSCGLSDALNVLEAALATPSQQEQPQCSGTCKGAVLDNGHCDVCGHPAAPEHVGED